MSKPGREAPQAREVCLRLSLNSPKGTDHTSQNAVEAETEGFSQQPDTDRAPGASLPPPNRSQGFGGPGQHLT